jgi:hypothetical protein
VGQSRCGEVGDKPGAGSLIAHPMATLAVEQEVLVRVSLAPPGLQGTEGIIAEVDHSADPALPCLIDGNGSLGEVDIVNERVQELPDSHPCSEQHQDHGPVPGVLDHREQSPQLIRGHGPGQGIGQLDDHPLREHVSSDDLMVNEGAEEGIHATEPHLDGRGLHSPVLFVFDPGSQVVSGECLEVGLSRTLHKGQKLGNGREGVSEGGGPQVSSVLIVQVLLNPVFAGDILPGESR